MSGTVAAVCASDPDAIYTGGDPTVAASYTCSNRPHFTNPFLLNGQHG